MNWEGEASAEPKLSASREVGKSADRERFGSPVGSLSQTPNKFGAHQIRHQPLAEASGMKFGLVARQNNTRCWLRSINRLHTCTLAHLHA
jgi:hypothetical protein